MRINWLLFLLGGLVAGSACAVESPQPTIDRRVKSASHSNRPMEIKKSVVPAFAFLTLFFAITPWRHPFLNQPLVLIVTAGLTALCIFAFRRKLLDWKTIALLTAMAYAASVVAALAGWSIDSHEGLTHLLDRLAPSASLEMVLGFPLFTYSAPIVLIVLAVNRLIGTKNPPRKLGPR